MHPHPAADIFNTSGDAAIDRRFIYARDLAARGDILAAIDLLDQCLERAPHWPPLHFQRGLYYQDAQDRDAAIAAYADYLRCDPDDCMGAAVKLALLGAMPAPHHFGVGYVQALFDHYAPHFDTALMEHLSYTVPQRLFALISDLRPAADNTERILDLGCGTGLAGERFSRRAACLDGVDLSPGMIAQAAAKQIYHRLEAADIGAYLQTPPALAYDIVLAADVFVYVGALEGVMPRIAAALAPGGLCAFSLQAAPGETFILGADHRFAHSKPYIERILAASALTIRQISSETLRFDGDKSIEGYLVIAEKPPAALGTGLAIAQDSVKERLKS